MLLTLETFLANVLPDDWNSRLSNLDIEVYYQLDKMLYPEEMTANLNNEGQLFLVLLYLEWKRA